MSIIKGEKLIIYVQGKFDDWYNVLVVKVGTL